MTRRPHIDVIVQGGGSGMGIAALLHGMVDIGMASRELSEPRNSNMLSRQGLKIRTFDLALDGIAVVVHPHNPVEVLTIEQLREIFTGMRQNWQDVGGALYPITVLSRMDGSGTALLFRQRVLGDQDYDGSRAPDAHQRGGGHRGRLTAVGHWVHELWSGAESTWSGQDCRPADQYAGASGDPYAGYHSRSELPLGADSPLVYCVGANRCRQGFHRLLSESPWPGTGQEGRVSCRTKVSCDMDAYRDLPWQQWGRQWAKTMWVAWGLVLLLVGQADAGDPAARLVVGTMHTPPFAIHSDDGHWSGLSIELLQQIAGTLGVEVEWREYDYDLQGLLHAVEQRHLDAAIAALPMNATYEETVDFSHPYFRTGLGIAVHRRPPQLLLGIIHGLFSWQFLGGVAILVGLLFGMGTVIWLLERRRNPHHFRPRSVQGIADGIWWSAVTMTTVGYGDKTPMTWAGRLMSLVWMFGSIFFIAFFTAMLTSSFTAVRLQQSVNGPEDLAWARVAVVSSTLGEELLGAQGLQPALLSLCHPSLQSPITGRDRGRGS